MNEERMKRLSRRAAALLLTVLWVGLIVSVIVYIAALVGPIAGVSIIGSTYRGPIKAIAGNLTVLGIGFSWIADWLRGRPLGPRWTPPPALSRYMVPFLMVIWTWMAVATIFSIVGVAFGKGAIPYRVEDAVYFLAVPASVYCALRLLKKYRPETVVSPPSARGADRMNG